MDICTRLPRVLILLGNIINSGAVTTADVRGRELVVCVCVMCSSGGKEGVYRSRISVVRYYTHTHTHGDTVYTREAVIGGIYRGDIVVEREREKERENMGMEMWRFSAVLQFFRLVV